MKLWLLRPIEGFKGAKDPWDFTYDMAYGFVIRAVSEAEARLVSGESGGDECMNVNPWLDPQYSSCIELTTEGDAGLIIMDFSAG